jgi:hypothetical protein
MFVLQKTGKGKKIIITAFFLVIDSAVDGDLQVKVWLWPMVQNSRDSQKHVKDAT